MGAEPVYLTLKSVGTGPGMAEFKNPDELEAWLKKQPRDVSLVIATRSALSAQGTATAGC